MHYFLSEISPDSSGWKGNIFNWILGPFGFASTFTRTLWTWLHLSTFAKVYLRIISTEICKWFVNLKDWNGFFNLSLEYTLKPSSWNGNCLKSIYISMDKKMRFLRVFFLLDVAIGIISRISLSTGFSTNNYININRYI